MFSAVMTDPNRLRVDPTTLTIMLGVLRGLLMLFGFCWVLRLLYNFMRSRRSNNAPEPTPWAASDAMWALIYLAVLYFATMLRTQ